jgi:hypothetical protein
VGTIDLSWTAPASDGGSPITGYRIQRRVGVAGAWSTVVSSTGSTSTSYQDAGLARGTTYYYQVAAINAIGTGAYSSVSSAIQVPAGAAGAPTGVSGVHGDAQVALSWTAPTDDGGAAVTGYRIERSPNGVNSWTVVSANTGSTTTSRTVTGLTNGQSYYFRVAAINSIDTGPWSAVSSAVTPLAPYSGLVPNSRYPATGSYDMSSGGTFDLGSVITVPGIAYGANPTGLNRMTFDAASGIFGFNSNFGTRSATVTVSWSVAESASSEGTSGTFVIYFS